MTQDKLEEIIKDGLSFSDEQKNLLNHPLIVDNSIRLIEANKLLLMLASTDPQVIQIIKVISILFRPPIW